MHNTWKNCWKNHRQNHKKVFRQGESGFTLTEVILALTLFTYSFMALFELYIDFSHLVSTGSDQNKHCLGHTLIILEKMLTESGGFEILNNGSSTLAGEVSTPQAEGNEVLIKYGDSQNSDYENDGYRNDEDIILQAKNGLLYIFRESEREASENESTKLEYVIDDCKNPDIRFRKSIAPEGLISDADNLSNNASQVDHFLDTSKCLDIIFNKREDDVGEVYTETICTFR